MICCTPCHFFLRKLLHVSPIFFPLFHAEIAAADTNRDLKTFTLIICKQESVGQINGIHMALHRSFPKLFTGGDPVERLSASLRHALSHEESMRLSIEFDERVARTTFLCVTARFEAQGASNRRPVPLPSKQARKSGDFTTAVELPRQAVSSPMLGFSTDDAAKAEAADDCVESVIELAMSASVKMLQSYDHQDLSQTRRLLASERRQRKGRLSASLSASDLILDSSIPHSSSRSMLSTSSFFSSPQLEAHLMLKYLRIERSALLFKYRTTWVETLEEHRKVLQAIVKPLFVQLRRPIAALILCRSFRMHMARKSYVSAREAVRLIQRVSRGATGRAACLRIAAVKLLACLVQRLGRGFIDRAQLASDFRSELAFSRSTAAATVIQAKFRMCSSRDKYLEIKVRKKCAVKIQRAVRRWLEVLFRMKRRLAAEEAEKLLQSRMTMSQARSCEAAERALIVCEEGDARDALLDSVCVLAAAMSRLSFVEQLISNNVKAVPSVLASTAVATSRADLTTPLLSSLVGQRSATFSEQKASFTTGRRRLQLQLVKLEQLETVDRQLRIVMLEHSERTALRQTYFAFIHRLFRL
jgi:hypothetical protein